VRRSAFQNQRGQHIWRWLGSYWIWQTEPAVFLGVGVSLVAFFPTLHVLAGLAIDVGVTWFLGWRLARLSDFE
jgi:hypothetical protein